MQPLVVFLVGMVGAVAPEIVRLYSLRAKGEAFSAFYFFISFLFAALGGFVAFVLPATTLWGAFYTGISAPVVVSTAVKKGLSGQTDLRGPTQAPDTPSPPSLIKFFKAL
jgi:hypothetical protein